MKQYLRRVVVCDEPERRDDCRPGPLRPPSTYEEGLARRYGEAWGLPYLAVGCALEQCELDDFVFYNGSYGAFIAGTPHWPEDQRRLRMHRTAQLYASRSSGEALEESGCAFAVPSSEMSGKKPGATSTFLYVVRDIARAAGLDTNDIFHTERYCMATSSASMSQEDMIARYLRTYWDLLGY